MKPPKLERIPESTRLSTYDSHHPACAAQPFRILCLDLPLKVASDRARNSLANDLENSAPPAATAATMARYFRYQRDQRRVSYVKVGIV